MLNAIQGNREPGPGRQPRARKDLVLQEMGEEGLLYDREGALVHILNLTALFTWRLCDGTRSIDEITETISGSFAGTGGKDIRRDVESVIARFAERGLLDRK